VEVKADAIDRLEWLVDFHVSMGDRRGELVSWDGRVLFSAKDRGQDLTLHARWVDCARLTDFYLASSHKLRLETDLPRDALDRIERLRSGGPLFARVQGVLVVHMPSGPPAHVSVETAPVALRDLWIGQVLATLRPPGRMLLELSIPPAPSDEKAASVLARITEAQRLFDHGEYDSSIREAYVALEALLLQTHKSLGRFEGGELGKQINSLKTIANATRHTEQERHGGFRAGRDWAAHFLVTARSLCAVVFRPRDQSTVADESNAEQPGLAGAT